MCAESAHMKQLTGLDATFLYLEKPEMPMHVGSMHLLELPDGYRGRFVNALRRHIAARLPAAPALRRRLWWMPLNMANPAWVDADPDLEAHIVEIRLPPGSRTRGDACSLMETQVARLHPILLDRHRPLWKMHVIEGLPRSPNGRRQVGLYTQLHHAAVDGQAAVALANVLFDSTPQPRQIDIRPSGRPRTFRLDMVEMLRGALGREVAQVARIVRDLPATLGTVAGTARATLSLRTLLGKDAGNVTLAPDTPMNVTVTPARSFAATRVPLAELKALAQAHQATLNDMVLVLCSGALRRYLQKRGVLPGKSLVAAVPISLREAGDTRADNQASMSLVSLGTHLASPAQRLRHIVRASTRMKSTMGRMRHILPTDYPSIGVPWLIEAAASLYGVARLAERLPQVANVVISNVPGPQMPLYLAGARVLSNHPTSIVVHGLALNITVQSFDASMDFGLMADGVALPDLRWLADAIGTTMDELRALPVKAPPAGPRPVSRKRPAAGGSTPKSRSVRR
ncbi:MAG: wax ester/triacylglycerol synthase family O-acyltransferase [Burkholderiales bacterium]|nr:MAG: wax ester/triacylglycerol synthase family O-acyltransferase [Burkholderiales bacterium]